WRRREVERPRLLECCDVAGVDVRQRREPGAREVVIVGAPFLRRRGRGPLGASGGGERNDEERGSAYARCCGAHGSAARTLYTDLVDPTADLRRFKPRTGSNAKRRSAAVQPRGTTNWCYRRRRS